MQQVSEFKAGCEGLLTKDINIIVDIMKTGGLCILPSDSSYILTGRINVPGVAADINDILNRNELEMSLSFNSVKQAHKTTELSNLAARFIESLTPGGLTFIARPSSKQTTIRFLRRIYVEDGTIGIRISESTVETQLAESFPFPSTPIREGGIREVSDADIALEIVLDQMRKKKIFRNLALVRGEVIHPGILSTVVKEIKKDGFLTIEIIRKGIIPIEEIRRVADSCLYEGVVVHN